MSQPKPARIVMQRCGWAGVRPVLRGGETGKGPHLAYPDDPYGTLTQEEMIDQPKGKRRYGIRTR